MDDVLELQVTDAEWRAIERAARRDGMSVEVWCRMVLLEAARVEILKRERMDGTR